MKQSERHDLSQRVRIGLTGLACVFLLVLLGAIFVKFVHEGERDRVNEAAIQSGSANVAALAGNAAETPKEPLAELGIAPGNAPAEHAPPQSAGKTVPPRP